MHVTPLYMCRIQDGPLSASKLLGVEEDDARETAAMQQNWQGLDPSPSYIRYTARIKAKGGGRERGREEEGAQGGKKEKAKWKEEGCVFGIRWRWG